MLRFLCERIDDRALARQTQLRIRTTGTTDDGLSQREKEVLGLIVQGFRNPEIARTLFIAESTVKVHVRHIFEKLGVRTRAEAAARFSSP
jgi:ATP/maltotriose-dependent transcriptional regulator MalT